MEDLKLNVTEDSCLSPIKINCKLWSVSPFATWQLGSFREKMLQSRFNFLIRC